MASPKGSNEILAALKSEGCVIQEYGDWRNHNRNHVGLWGPVHGVVIHHTVTSTDDGSVALCYDGHPTLPGPLCHGVGRNDGRIALVGHGRANHAGSGDGDVLQAVINETDLPADDEADTDGNRYFYGLEIVNEGDGVDTYPWVQYVQAVKWATAHLRMHGWTEKSVIGHKEWQPGKIDPYGPVIGPDGSTFQFTMDRFRAHVRSALALPAGAWPLAEEEEVTPEDIQKVAEAVLDLDGKIKNLNPKTNEANPYLALKTAASNTDWVTRRTELALARVESKVDALAVGGVDLDVLAAKVADLLAARLVD
jgi:hypothetical protein